MDNIIIGKLNIARDEMDRSSKNLPLLHLNSSVGHVG